MAETSAAGTDISVEELQLAARNHALPLEALRREITPVGLHLARTLEPDLGNNAVQRVRVSVE